MSDEFNWSHAAREAKAARLEQEIEQRGGGTEPRSESATGLAAAAAGDRELATNLTEAPEPGDPSTGRKAEQRNEVTGAGQADDNSRVGDGGPPLPVDPPLISSPGLRENLNAAGAAIGNAASRPDVVAAVHKLDLQQIAELGASAGIGGSELGVLTKAALQVGSAIREHRTVDPDSPEGNVKQHNEVNDSHEQPKEPVSRGVLIQGSERKEDG